MRRHNLGHPLDQQSLLLVTVRVGVKECVKKSMRGCIQWGSFERVYKKGYERVYTSVFDGIIGVLESISRGCIVKIMYEKLPATATLPDERMYLRGVS